MAKREVEIVVLSDIHLATYGCHATELVAYLKSINPKLLILNGDIIDGWAFSKKYFPNSHMAVLSEFFKMMKSGTQIIYITGNHDEFLRKYSDLKMEGYDYILERQLKPEARTDIKNTLNELGVKPTSMIDISDGLSSEILH